MSLTFVSRCSSHMHNTVLHIFTVSSIAAYWILSIRILNVSSLIPSLLRFSSRVFGMPPGPPAVQVTTTTEIYFPDMAASLQISALCIISCLFLCMQSQGSDPGALLFLLFCRLSQYDSRLRGRVCVSPL